MLIIGKRINIIGWERMRYNKTSKCNMILDQRSFQLNKDTM
jgi:hypothetical protein